METENRPHVKPGEIRYTKGYGWRLLAKRIKDVTIILFALTIIAGSIYTLYRQPVRTSDGIVTAELVNRIHTEGDKVVIVRGDSYHMFTPLVRMIKEQVVYEGVIIAGPYGEIKEGIDGYRIISSGIGIGVNFENYPGEYLDNEYVVRKIDKDGNILPNEYDEVVNKNMILGLVE